MWRLFNEIVRDGDGPSRVRNVDRIAMRQRRISLSRHVVSGHDALLNGNRIGWRIQKGVVLDCYAQNGTDPDVFLSRQFAAREGTVLYCGAADTGGLRYAPKTRRIRECAVLYRDVVRLDVHRRAAEIYAAEHSAGLSDVHDICRRGIIVGRLGVLADFRDVEQRRRGVRIAGHRIDARQDGARIVVSDRLNLCSGDHAIVPRSQRGTARRAEQ